MSHIPIYIHHSVNGCVQWICLNFWKMSFLGIYFLGVQLCQPLSLAHSTAVTTLVPHLPSQQITTLFTWLVEIPWYIPIKIIVSLGDLIGKDERDLQFLMLADIEVIGLSWSLLVWAWKWSGKVLLEGHLGVTPMLGTSHCAVVLPEEVGTIIKSISQKRTLTYEVK